MKALGTTTPLNPTALSKGDKHDTRSNVLLETRVVFLNQAVTIPFDILASEASKRDRLLNALHKMIPVTAGLSSIILLQETSVNTQRLRQRQYTTVRSENAAGFKHWYALV